MTAQSVSNWIFFSSNSFMEMRPTTAQQAEKVFRAVSAKQKGERRRVDCMQPETSDESLECQSLVNDNEETKKKVGD